MKRLLILALAGFSTLALADDLETSAQVEKYDYSQQPDIAKVISISAIPNVCEVVPAKMVYEDHQGQRHTLEYQVMGNGCANG
ncbi:DUF2790 domain-containing protein [Pseudomonas sp. R5(2019)]|uniref:DUF2790 domain-containing protein n=1 Tax=Pseudomonas sp. R5(2019) TaxID=2697566 RepID=UPI001412D332|nr:DUF2790 domain-containing protein [Pseudomonas sp. R5(2019)]NBA97936.1 DUF2790 domain-containing protein [Pseudomonas sp. R5(2019)]